MPNTVKVSVAMEITVYQSSILVEYCDLKYFHCIPWIFILLYFQSILSCTLMLDILGIQQDKNPWDTHASGIQSLYSFTHFHMLLPFEWH